MEQINWKRKISSRKFWALLTGLGTSIMVLMNISDNTTSYTSTGNYYIDGLAGRLGSTSTVTSCAANSASVSGTYAGGINRIYELRGSIEIILNSIGK